MVVINNTECPARCIACYMDIRSCSFAMNVHRKDLPNWLVGISFQEPLRDGDIGRRYNKHQLSISIEEPSCEWGRLYERWNGAPGEVEGAGWPLALYTLRLQGQKWMFKDRSVPYTIFSKARINRPSQVLVCAWHCIEQDTPQCKINCPGEVYSLFSKN
jgi:hypothetical protein